LEVLALDSAIEEDLGFVYASYLKARAGGASDVARHPGLIREIADLLGIAAPRYLLVVTGSKGKGSVASLAASALSGSGRRTGLVTSPHLVHVAERMRIDGQAIADAELLAIAAELRPWLERYAATLPAGVYLGPSGIYLLFALHWFQRQGVDTAVVEAGRGGLLDEATRFGHQVAAITRVRPEHLHEMGPGLEDVARHKAGAIPVRGTALVARQDSLAHAALATRAALAGARLLQEGEDFSGDLPGREVEITTLRGGGARRFSFQPRGPYQAGNAALALAAAEELCGTRIDGPRWADLQLPGRLQLVHEAPDVIVDGAIVQESAEVAVRLAVARGGRPLVAVVGVPADKDYRGVIAAAARAADRIVITRTATPRLSYPADALAHAEGLRPSSETETLGEALRQAEDIAGRDGTVLVLGTQSIVAEALAHYGADTRDIY
jgi:dihydrofolate synthase/folylpolyglutamate synthase